MGNWITVSEEVIKAKLTTLFHESFYKLQKPQSSDYYTQAGRWLGIEDSESYFIQYLWIDNKAVEVNRR